MHFRKALVEYFFPAWSNTEKPVNIKSSCASDVGFMPATARKLCLPHSCAINQPARELENYLDLAHHNSIFHTAAAHAGGPSRASTYVEHRVLDAFRLFVRDPVKLMQILHTTRSIVSGSTALAVIAGGAFVPNDLDVYVPASQENNLLALLETYLGFHVDAAISSDKLYDDNTALKSVRWLTVNSQGKKINVMTCTGESAVLAVFSFHSTMVMNFISSYGIYCAYPDLTMAKKAIPTSNYFTEMRGYIERRCFVKYRSRGYNIKLRLDTHLLEGKHICYVHPSCPLTVRSIYDGHGAFVRFSDPSTAADANGAFIYDDKHSTLWSLGGPACHQGIYHSRMAQSFQIENA